MASLEYRISGTTEYLPSTGSTASNSRSSSASDSPSALTAVTSTASLAIDVVDTKSTTTTTTTNNETDRDDQAESVRAKLEALQPPIQVYAVDMKVEDDVDNLSEPDEERYHRILSSRITDPITKRREKAPAQLAQIVQYSRLMEERVQLLEKEVQELQGDQDDDNDKTDEEDRKILPPRLLPKVQRLIWTDYLAAPQTHVIDVLYGEPEDATSHIAAEEIWRKRRMIGFATRKTTAPPDTAQPTRIRIHSELLKDELREVTGFAIEGSVAVVIAPFKPFIHCADKIRARMDVLNDRLKGLEATMATRLPLEPEILQQIYEGKPNIDVDSPSESQTLGRAMRAERLQVASRFSKSGGASTPVRKIACMTPNSTEYDNKIRMHEDRLNPQDIGRLMYACDLSRRQVVSKLKRTDDYASKKAQLTKNATDAQRKIWEDNVDLFEARLLVDEWKAVIDLLDNELAPIFHLRKDIVAGQRTDVSFDDLCHLFQPGQLVVGSEDKARVLRVFSVTGGRRLLNDSAKPMGRRKAASAGDQALAAFQSMFHSEKWSPLVVDCFHFDFNGSHFGPVQTTFEIRRFETVQRVASLSVFPIEFFPEHNVMQRTLQERGRKFLDLCASVHGVHKKYNALSIDDPPELIDSQIVVDFDMASRVGEKQQPLGKGWVPKLGLEGPSPTDKREIETSAEQCYINDCAGCSHSIVDDQSHDLKASKEFVDLTPNLNGMPVKCDQLLAEHHILLPNRVFGFVLRSRKWARLHIDSVEPIEHDEKNFERLVLPDGYRELVQALVETHFRPPNPTASAEAAFNADLVRGKGKGLIMLLHGAPGVGKTSTAECVAEYTKKPLFVITCGDIGESAADVERNLDRCFQMAHRWGCILLLDEADVFLEQRDRRDLQRNALVSVFLRVLEYYAGILFLTTNRVGTFDEAFKSRIHMSLRYPTLDKKSTKSIWQMNLDRTMEKQSTLGVKIDSAKIMKFARRHWKETERYPSSRWNGRQIRNAFQTAIALAQWERRKLKDSNEDIVLDEKHFEKVSQASRDFNNYLTDIYDEATDGDRALEDGLRADDWGMESRTDGKDKYRRRSVKDKKGKKERKLTIEDGELGNTKKSKKSKKSRRDEDSSDSSSSESDTRKSKKKKDIPDTESESDS